MAKGSGGGGWGWFIIGGGGLLLYALKKRSDDRLGDDIDRVVEALNKGFGHGWVTVGLNLLEAHLRRVLPPQVVAFVDVVHFVERQAYQAQMVGQPKPPGSVKKSLAMDEARRRGLAGYLG
jgi:hypothetical protein